jgi:hypothetical protein
VAGSCEYGDEPSGSGATELVGRSVSQVVTLTTYNPIQSSQYPGGEGRPSYKLCTLMLSHPSQDKCTQARCNVLLLILYILSYCCGRCQ